MNYIMINQLYKKQKGTVFTVVIKYSNDTKIPKVLLVKEYPITSFLIQAILKSKY